MKTADGITLPSRGSGSSAGLVSLLQLHAAVSNQVGSSLRDPADVHGCLEQLNMLSKESHAGKLNGCSQMLDVSVRIVSVFKTSSN